MDHTHDEPNVPIGSWKKDEPEPPVLMIHQRCGFCGKSHNHVELLVFGYTAFICNECVELCMKIISEKRAEKKKGNIE